jgi:hypothetical protein
MDGCDSDLVSKPNEIRDTSYPELRHHSPPVNFHGLFNGAEAGRNLLVKAARDDVFEHFPLAMCQGGKEVAD